MDAAEGRPPGGQAAVSSPAEGRGGMAGRWCFVLLPCPQGCTAPVPPASMAGRPALSYIAPAWAQSSSHLSAQAAAVSVHITGGGPVFLGRLEVLVPAQGGLLPRGQGPAALHLAPGSESPQWGGKEEEEGS